MTAPCVRCGRRPRYADTFLCETCRRDPATWDEVRMADPFDYHDEHARHELIRRAHWAGGWPKDRTRA